MNRANMIGGVVAILVSVLLNRPAMAVTDSGTIGEVQAGGPEVICAQLYQVATPAAFEACNAAAEIYPERAESWQRLGQLNFRAGSHEAARGHFDKALTLGEAAGDAQAQSLALNGLARVSRALGAMQDARGLFGRSLALCGADVTCLAGNHDALGYIALKARQFTAAHASFGACLEVTEGAGEPKLQASCLYGRATVYYQQDAFEEAAGLCEQSLALYEKAGNRRGMAASLGCLASTAKNRRLDLAIWCDYQSRRAALYRELGDTPRSLKLRAGIARSNCPK